MTLQTAEELRLEKIRAGEWRFDDIYLERIAVRHPERVVSVLDAVSQAWIERIRMHQRDSEDHELPRWPLRDDCLDAKVLAAVRANADQAWPVFAKTLRLLTTLRRVSTRGLRSIEDLGNRKWHLRHTIENARDFVERLTIAALEGLVRSAPERVESMLSSLTHARLRGMEYAIANGLLGAADEHADFILSWLCGRTSRFRLGDGHKELYWEPARALIQRFAPHCSDILFDTLEAEILQYHEPWEYKSYEWHLENLREDRFVRNDWGHAQNVLLGALPVPRMSERARLVASAWRAKFGDPADEKPLNAHSAGGWVTSPIPPQKLMFVSDRDWLRIISGQWSEREGRRWRRHGVDTVGEASVRHFADALGNATGRDPKRFAALALKIPSSSDPRYFTSIVNALARPQTQAEDPASGEVGPGEFEAILEHVCDCSDAGYVQSVCNLVRSRTEIRWSDAVIDRTIGFVNHPEPTADTFTVHTREGPDTESKPDIAMTAISCVRGCVASAITHLLWTRSDASDRLLPAAERLLDDVHPAVRHEALGACLPIMRRDKDLAVRLAVAACGHDDDRVSGSHWLNSIIGYARSTHLDQIAQLIVRMVRSQNDNIAESGAAWVTACWIDGADFAHIVNECRAGSKAQRLGVIVAAADYFAADRAIELVDPILREMFDASDLDIRSRAAGIFRYMNVLDNSQAIDLASSFVDSRAFLDDPGNLLHPLSEYDGNTEPFSQVILRSADRVSSALAGETRDMRQRNAYAGNEVSGLLLRLYERAYGTQNRLLQDECLDRWDGMLRCRVGMTTDHLKQLDD